MTLVANDAHPWIGRSRKGHEEYAGTDVWSELAACKDDDRFIDRGISEGEVAELIEMCHNCPVEVRCFLWALAQTQPVGFVVAGGERWKAWNHCAMCGKKVRGIDRCADHMEARHPAGTIDPGGAGRPYSVTDEH